MLSYSWENVEILTEYRYRYNRPRGWLFPSNVRDEPLTTAAVETFLLVYKRLEAGRFQWPRTASEAREITPEQFTWLMQGLAVEQKRRIQEIRPKRTC